MGSHGLRSRGAQGTPWNECTIAGQRLVYIKAGIDLTWFLLRSGHLLCKCRALKKPKRAKYCCNAVMKYQSYWGMLPIRITASNGSEMMDYICHSKSTDDIACQISNEQILPSLESCIWRGWQHIVLSNTLQNGDFAGCNEHV